MSTTLTPAAAPLAPNAAFAAEPPPRPGRKRWTRGECDFLERLGLIAEPYELLGGEIILKVGQNQPHAMTVIRLIAWLISVFGVTRVQTQTTIEIAENDRPTNRPGPDALVLARPDYELGRTPTGGEDLVFVAEVSDATLGDDLGAKAALYARAGIPEYWVIDVTGRQLFVHRSPAGGNYAEVIPCTANDVFAPLAAPETTVRVADLLPPSA